MSKVKLNLARKWRSKQFEEIVGQDLSIRMLKNSLYLQQYFPVYLFSGQRGCGKTTTARVFATSLNCDQLPLFQKDPKSCVLPCLSCDSCKAMERGKHPDFIEIDAASHTGVDHVRMLIDSAALLPLMGRKKIYLIDEAHMLSKAAFNALLKILEEPPASVLFILATTDPQKIIETVHSRCFQLFFRPVSIELLHARLREVCLEENILFDDNGLALIVKQTEGSVRDALNLLEQVRFSSAKVTHDAVLNVLGFIDDSALLGLLEKLSSPPALLKAVKELAWERYSAHIIWVQLLEFIRAALWLKYEVAPDSFTDHHETLKKITSLYSATQLTTFLQTMYDQELLFTKTVAKHDFIEMVLMQLCQGVDRSNSEGGTSASSSPALEPDEVADEEEDFQEHNDDEQEQETVQLQWKRFVTRVDSLNDPLLHSIFAQGIVQHIDEHNLLQVEFCKEFLFFDDLLDQTKADWQPLLNDIFGDAAIIKAVYTGASRKPMQKIAVASSQPVEQKVSPSLQTPPSSAYQRRTYPPRVSRQSYKPFAKEAAIDISDQKVWAKTHMIMRHLPGSITEVRE